MDREIFAEGENMITPQIEIKREEHPSGEVSLSTKKWKARIEYRHKRRLSAQVNNDLDAIRISSLQDIDELLAIGQALKVDWLRMTQSEGES
jgi:hypothetical protein